MKIYIETYGCTTNQSDSIVLKSLLEKKGHIIVKSEGEADYIVINTCSVKTPTENKILRRISELSSLKKPMVVTGCLAQVSADKILQTGSNTLIHILGTRNIDKICDVISYKTPTRYLKQKQLDKTGLRGVQNACIVKISISEGCLGNCSYCQTKIARGGLYSFPPQNIIKEIKDNVSNPNNKNMIKHIWLTSQDTAVYGLDRNFDIYRLLKQIEDIQGNFIIRLGMANPLFLKKYVEKIADILKGNKFFEFLHIPVQSGSDSILSHMKRGYCIRDFLDIIETLRDKIPDIFISTDIIVGYPTETEEDFLKSYKLIEKIKPDTVNVSRFMPRPGTEAATLKQLPGHVSKYRSRVLTSLCEKIRVERLSKYKGRVMDVYVESPGKKGGYRTRSKNYQLIMVEDAEPGEKIKVKITGYTSTYLIGKRIC